MEKDIWSMTPEELLQYFQGTPEYAKLQYEDNPGYGLPSDEAASWGSGDIVGYTPNGLPVYRPSTEAVGNGEVGDGYMESWVPGENYAAILARDGPDRTFLEGSYDLDGNLTGVTKGVRPDFLGTLKEALPAIALMAPAALGFAAPGLFSGAAGAGTAAADGGLGFAAGNEFAGLAASEAGFGGSAGLAGLEAALAGGAGAAGTAALDVSFDPFKDVTNAFDTPTSAGAEAGGNFWDEPYMDAFETTPYPGQSITLPFQAGDTGTTLLGSLGDLFGGAGSSASGLGSLLSGGKGLGALLGGLAGGLNAAGMPDSTTVTQKKIVDPRMDALIFGDGENDLGLMGMWKANLNRKPSAALGNMFGIANNFFGA